MNRWIILAIPVVTVLFIWGIIYLDHLIRVEDYKEHFKNKK